MKRLTVLFFTTLAKFLIRMFFIYTGIRLVAALAVNDPNSTEWMIGVPFAFTLCEMIVDIFEDADDETSKTQEN